MANAGVIILGSVFSIAILVGIGYAVMQLNKREDIPTDNVFIENLIPQYTDSYVKGNFVKLTTGPRRSIVEFTPMDINFNKPQKIRNQRVVVENELIYSIPKGKLSQEVGFLYLLPSRAEDIPDAIKKSPMGQGIMEFIEKRMQEKEVSDVLRKRNDNLNQIYSDLKGLDVIIEDRKHHKTLTKDLLKIKAGDKGEKGNFFGNQGNEQYGQ